MKNKKYFIASIALCALFSFSALATPAYGATTVVGATHELYTITGLIDLLVTRGIISEEKAEKARMIVELILKTEEIKIDDEFLLTDIDVAVSQFIEHGDLTYNALEDIEGLLLTVKNTSDEANTLEAKRQCQVVYRIYDESDTLVYDYADESKCQTLDKVTYVLEAGATRIFPITHDADTFALKSGTYRFEIEYPGYGKGEKIVTIR